MPKTVAIYLPLPVNSPIKLVAEKAVFGGRDTRNSLEELRFPNFRSRVAECQDIPLRDYSDKVVFYYMGIYLIPKLVDQKQAGLEVATHQRHKDVLVRPYNEIG